MARSWSSKTRINGYINMTAMNHCRRLSIWWYSFIQFMHTALKISSSGINQDALLSCCHNIIRVHVHDVNKIVILWELGSLANTSIPPVSIVPLNCICWPCLWSLSALVTKFTTPLQGSDLPLWIFCSVIYDVWVFWSWYSTETTLFTKNNFMSFFFPKYKTRKDVQVY